MTSALWSSIIYTQDDLEALARGDYPDDAPFTRVRVNNTLPLAAWLQEVGTSISDATLHGTHPQQKRDQVIPYTFQIVVSGGLAVKYNLASPLWPMVAAEVSGSMQKTNTIIITLNGLDSQAAYFAQFSGGAKNSEAPNALPTIDVSGSAKGLPAYVGRRHPRGQPLWPYLVISPPRH